MKPINKLLAKSGAKMRIEDTPVNTMKMFYKPDYDQDNLIAGCLYKVHTIIDSERIAVESDDDLIVTCSFVGSIVMEYEYEN